MLCQSVLSIVFDVRAERTAHRASTSQPGAHKLCIGVGLCTGQQQSEPGESDVLLNIHSAPFAAIFYVDC